MDPEIEQLYDAIFTRSANRKNGMPQPIPDEILSHFRKAAEKEGVELRLTTDRNDILANATMLAEADQWRFLIPHVHEDMMAEVKFPGKDDLDIGLDVRSLEMDETSLPLTSLLQRGDVMHHLAEWGGGKVLGMRTQVAVASSSALALFTVPRSEPTWYLRAGAAVQRVWLLAEQAGLQVQPSSPLYLFANDDEDMVKLAGVRKVEQLTAHGQNFRSLWQIGEYDAMAMVLRIFHADPPTVRSIRLPLEEQVSRSGAETFYEALHENF
jgi:nitroreductase